jgi:hypothetical protein
MGTTGKMLIKLTCTSDKDSITLSERMQDFDYDAQYTEIFDFLKQHKEHLNDIILSDVTPTDNSPKAIRKIR